MGIGDMIIIRIHKKYDKFQKKNEEKMPAGKYLNTPFGGACLYLRHDVVSNEVNKMLKEL